MKTGDSFILRAVATFLFFLINLFAIYLLFRGHNLPGGGFIGGLGSALTFILLSLACGVETAQRLLHFDPVRIAATGLLLAVLTGLAPVLFGAAFLTQYNVKLKDVPLLGDLALGTPLLFDLGVFLVVVGVTAKLVFLLSRSITGLPALAEADRPRYAAALEEPVEETRSGRAEDES